MPTLKALVFDWGDTLMRMYPQFSGSMLHWPEVAAISGAAEALRDLQPHYTLIVATNATDSSAAQVLQALDRVGLGRFITSVFTPVECDAQKPDLAFFQAIQNALGLQPDQLCMVGDSYTNDILGAQRAGWASLWYNPEAKAAPGLNPLHDFEIINYDRLSAVISAQDIPSHALCLNWLKEHDLPQNLLAHVRGVAAAAYQMSVWLRAAGVQVNPLLTQRAALLHDLAKIKAAQPPFAGRISHADLAAQILTERGFPLLADIVRRHMLFSLTDPHTQPLTWEQKLVYFADKIIEADRPASIAERAAGLCRRYPESCDQIKKTLPALFTMQEELCAAAAIPASDLVQRLREAFIVNGIVPG